MCESKIVVLEHSLGVVVHEWQPCPFLSFEHHGQNFRAASIRVLPEYS